jgi:hypothetical protein
MICDEADDSIDDELCHPEQSDGQQGGKDARKDPKDNDGAPGLPHETENGRHVTESREPLPPTFPKIRFLLHDRVTLSEEVGPRKFES